MNKPSRSFPRPLSELLSATLSDVLKAQGFASTEIISRWNDIVGAEVAAHSEPLKINWPRTAGDEKPEPATLILRVEGPAALEIQHQAPGLEPGVLLAAATRVRRVAQCHSQPSQQLTHTKGLGQVVISPQFQGCNLILIAGTD